MNILKKIFGKKQEEGLTAGQIALVQESFSHVEPIAETAAELFYGRLFELDASLKPLFKGDMTEQGKKLMSVLKVAVSSLNKLDELTPTLETLAVRHVGYGVKNEHYATVGEALIWTLEKGLGDAFTPEVKQAWLLTYQALSETMKAAALKNAA